MNLPKIGIYMPSYNHGRYVADAVDSIVNQTYSNWELFIVNDGSTDNTGEVLRKYEDERIHYYEFKENTRYVGAANFLQNLLKGLDFDYIADLASDDMWREDKLEKQVNYLLKHPEYKACFTWDKIIFEEDSTCVYRGNENYSHKTNQNRYEWILDFYQNGNCLNACSMLIEKDLFYELDRMNQNYIQIADYRLWFKMILHVPFYLMEEELTYYRRHGANLSNPTNEIVSRTANEVYAMFSEIRRLITAEVFRRSLYMLVPYPKCSTKEELLAALFIVTMNARWPSIKQVALDIYYENCSNEDFVAVLEQQYFFRPRDFIDITGNMGLIFQANLMTDHNPLPQKNSKVYTPAYILLDAIDAGRLDEAFIKEASYSTLFDLYTITSELEGGYEKFSKIKKAVEHIRQKGRKTCPGRKLLFLAADSSASDIGEIIEEFRGEADECTAAYVRTRKNCFNDEYIQPPRKAPDNVRLLNLYNENEHCHYFLHEIGECADVIYFVDCLDCQYELGDMLAGCPLEVEANCLLSREEYERMLGSEGRILSMMQEIMVYTG